MRNFLPYTLLLAALVLPERLHAQDELDAVMDEKRKLELLESKENKLFTLPDPASVYGQMLQHNYDLTQMIKWVTTGYENKEVTQLRGSHDEDDFLFAEATLNRADLPTASMLIVIPRPKNQVAAEYGLLRPYIRVRPIKADILTMKRFTVSGFRAEIYELRRNECRMLVDLPHKGLLKLDTENCKDPGAFFLYENELTLERLIRKLQS